MAIKSLKSSSISNNVFYRSMLAGNDPNGVFVVGQQEFSLSTTFVVPNKVVSISLVAVGAGGRGSISNDSSYQTVYGGMGGGLSYSNDLVVTPGESLTIVIGAAAALPSTATGNYLGTAGGAGGFTQVLRGSTVLLSAQGGGGGQGGGAASTSRPNGTAVGQVSFIGGVGGTGVSGGAAAAGYSSNGPNSKNSEGANTGNSGSGGSGSSGAGPSLGGNGSVSSGGRGGGVGLRGQTNSGSAPSTSGGFQANDGLDGSTSLSGTAGGGTAFGQSGAGQWAFNSGAAFYSRSQGSPGGVRIIWGPNRAYPATNTFDMEG